MKANTTSLLLSTLMLAIGLNVTACSKHENAESKPTEEIAAEQGELAKKANPAPTASQPATQVATATAASTTATATASTTTVTTTTTKTETASASAPVKAEAAAGGDAGEKLYAATCKTCHETGLAGAPKVGDKAAWKDRIAQGNDTMHQHAIAGFQGKTGVMPPKGGSTAPDDEVKAAVDYMVKKSS